MIVVFGSFGVDPPPCQPHRRDGADGTTADGRQRHQPGSGSGLLWQRPGRSHDLAQRAADCFVGVLVVSMNGRSSPPRGDGHGV
jgi:hypothetical protein